ncbi:tectonin domain-containing protein [Dyella silvatica]|uniref:tectonin domain-containing protein n=1 Tax=Dyella silvatica TaxID=2992128 RepID=UPI002254A4C0|nr:tectonin domain-containing protein [Dyella silvatica]
MLFAGKRAVAIRADGGVTRRGVKIIYNAIRWQDGYVYMDGSREATSWLIMPVDLADPDAGYVFSSSGYYLSNIHDYIQQKGHCLVTTPNLDHAARFVPVTQGDGTFYLQEVGHPAVFTLDTRGFLTQLANRAASNAEPLFQHFRVHGGLSYDDDIDQYYWICHTRTQGALSVAGKLGNDAALTVQPRLARYDQLWKYRNGALVCKANGHVIQAAGMERGAAIAAVTPGDSVRPSQAWVVDRRGHILIAGGRVGLHCADGAIGGSVVLGVPPATPEWYLIPCVMEPDVTENRLESEEGNTFLLRNLATDCVLSAVTPLTAGGSVCLQPVSAGSSSWMRLPGSLQQISAGHAECAWGVNAAGDIFQHSGEDASPWVQVDGRLSSVSVGVDDCVWGVDSLGGVYRRDGEKWTHISAGMAQISVASARQVWGLDGGGNVYRYSGDDSHPWIQIAGNLSNIAAGADGSLWGCNSAGKVFRRDGEKWTLIPGALKQVAVGSAGMVWGVDGVSKLHQYTHDDVAPWASVPGTASWISIAVDGTAWAVDRDGGVYRNVPAPVPPHQLWTYHGGQLKSTAGDFVLEDAGDGLKLATPGSQAPDRQAWLLSAEGYLMPDRPDALLVVPVANHRQVAFSHYSPLRPRHQIWQTEAVRSSINSHANTAVPDVLVTSLSVEITLADEWFAGTDDDIHINFNLANSYSRRQLVAHGLSAGQLINVDIDVAKMFRGRGPIHLSDLNYVGLWQRPITHWFDNSDRWKLKSLILIVNGRYYNRSFQSVNDLIDNPKHSMLDTWRRSIPNTWTDISPSNRSIWMTSGYELIKERTLRELVIPGSHDAGMYLGGISIVGKTQDLSIYDQLKEGVRYFDIRPLARKAADGSYSFVTYHGISMIVGASITDILNDVARFMREPGKELVILKMSHFSAFDTWAYQALVQQVRSKLGVWLCAKQEGVRLAQRPLKDLAGRNGGVLVVCDERYSLDYKADGIFTYRDWHSEDPENGDLTVLDNYANTTDLDKMKQDQGDKFMGFNGRCLYKREVPCDLFLLSWTLTPVTAVWFYAKVANEDLPRSMRIMSNPNTFDRIINIIYVDYVEYSHATDLCLELNGIRL